MLNKKDLAIIRAALQYFDEEFTPSDDNLLTHYLDDRGVLAGAKVADIKTTRVKLDLAKAYLGLKRAGELELVSTEILFNGHRRHLSS